MKQTWAIAKKEIFNYLTQPVGYVFAGLLLLVANWMFFSDIFVQGQADIRPLFSNVVLLFSLFVPAISMGLIADEKKSGNWEVMLSLPINETQMVIGKFLGSAIYLTGVTLLLAPTVGVLFYLGTPDIGMVIGGAIGVILLGAAYLSVGLLASCLSNSSVVAFMITTIFLVINNLFNQDVLLSRLPGGLKTVIQTLSLAAKSDRLSTGLINLNDLLFFLSWMTVSVILSVIVLKGRDK